MKRVIIPSFLILLLLGLIVTPNNAQTASTSDNLVAQPVPDRIVLFDVTNPGISKTVEFGADLAWPSEQNFRRALIFMGTDQVDVARVSYQPTHPLLNGDLQQPQIDDLNWRLYLLQTYADPGTEVVMNVDAPAVDPYYYGNAGNWSELVKVTANRIQATGHTVVSVGPMNEPDYSTHQGTIDDFYDITVAMRNDPFFDNVRISGGNVLNCDLATDWYNYLRPAGVDEGNTHQLAGGFDAYASFYQTVKANGDFASNDELHNVMEALVGYEYGMEMGIWWGPADLARGEMVKAFDGERIAYAEHRPNWTAAAVYRTPEGKIQAFGGTSERQAANTTYNYISKDRVVYYDGHGPQREFVLEMPGGTGYWTGQSNAERVINITWGDDIQPLINGRYKLVNRNSGLVMEIGGDPSQNGTNVQQGNYTGATTQQWDVYPVDSRIGGDFSYYRIIPVANSSKSLDLFGYSLDNGGNLDIWDIGSGGNHQWYLDYAGDGWFYIRSRESAKCIDVFGASMNPGGNIAQWEKLGGLNQQWRLLPIDAPIEFVAPAAPNNLAATANAVSIQLDWMASPDADVAGYTIFRAESATGPYNTIARNVTTTSFVDNTALSGMPYYYAIKAVDQSLNRSDYSNQVSATATGDDALVMHLPFEDVTKDNTINLNHSASHGGVSFIGGGVGAKSVVLNGTDAFLQLPADVANHQEITVATWVYWNGGGAWQRVFDFGNGTEENMFLTPATFNGEMQFGLSYGGMQQNLYTSELPTGQLVHLAVTLGASGIRLYVDGQEVAQENTATISPLDFKPVLNYIGRSQYPDPLFNGRIDDFRIYNYALSPAEVEALANVPVDAYTTVEISSIVGAATSFNPIPVTITFGENVTGFELSDITVGNGMASNLQEIVSGTTWTADITPLAEGIVTVDVAAGVATDLMGNDNEAADQFSVVYTAELPVTSAKLIGNTTTWENNGPQDLSIAFDGDFNTHVDSYTYWGFLGYDFGEGAGATVSSWKYAPRAGFAWRMNGTQLRGSNSPDYLNDFDVLYTVPDNPAEGVLTEAVINSPTEYRYIYWFGGGYTYSNIAEFALFDAGNNPLIGTPVGFEGGSQWCAECTYDKAFDGDLNTYVEGPESIGYVGYDFGEGNGISLTSWKYAPRYGWAFRMDGTELRGSNDPDYLNNYTVLSTISSTPSEGTLTQAVVNDPTSYRYVYWSGGVNSFGNISELELYGSVKSSNFIGNTTTWQNNGPQDLSVAFDGDFNTHVDGWEYWGFLGYDFGEGTEVSVATWKYAPRSGWAWRMNGSQLRGSNSPDYLNDFDVLYTVPDNPAEGVLTEAVINSSTAYRYLYWFGNAYSNANIAEFELYDSGNNQLIGTPVGFEGGSQWCAECTYDKALDGDLNTFVEGPQTIGYVGYDFGEGIGMSLTSWKYAPRYGFAWRMDGTELRGSNDPDYLNNYTVLSTISSTPAEGELTQADILDPTTYRYVYWAGGPNSFGNISELELDGTLTCNDKLPPAITCPADQTRSLNSSCSYTLEDFTGLATDVSDDCTVSPTITQFPTPGTVINTVGPNQVTLTATDDVGNSASCVFTLTIEDSNPPIPVCKTATVELSAEGLYTLQEADVYDAGASADNCGIVNVSFPATTYDCDDVGPSLSVEVTATDAVGNTASCMASITVEDNNPPVPVCKTTIVELTAEGLYTLQEADVYDAGASADNCGIVNVSFPATTYDCDDVGPSLSVEVTATDAVGNTASCMASITVEDNSTVPVVESISVPVDPVSLGNPTNVSGELSDICDFDDHTASWNWGDGSSSAGTVDQGTNIASGSHVYAQPGVYVVTLTITDGSSNSASLTASTFAVVYDPNGNFVTGGGWIMSPAGSYIDDPTLTGKANFGFVSKYQNGANVPTGNTSFQFKAGDFKFESTDYDWLVVAGTKAKFKGSGEVNNSGNYGFMLTAIDGDLQNNAGPDKFRIKIWDKNNGDAVVYDNQLGASDDGYDTQELGGGSITIHGNNGNGSLSAPVNPIVYESELNLELYPNPSREKVNLSISGLGDQAVEIIINDHTGKVVWRQQYLSLPTSTMTIDLSSGRFAVGMYVVSVITQEELLSKRLIVTK